MLIPYAVDVPFDNRPVVNWVLVVTIVLAFVLMIVSEEEAVEQWVLRGWGIKGLFGHMWLHGGIIHIVGNMLFLWLFGNAVCSKVGNLLYLPTYLLFGVLAAATHLICAGGPAVGASGAINGLVGMYVVFFPRNDISCAWVIILWYTKTFSVSGFWIIGLWLFFDIWGALSGVERGVGYYAHIGGFLAGFVIAFLMLKYEVVTMESDEESILDLIRQQRQEKKAQAGFEQQMDVTERLEAIRTVPIEGERQEAGVEAVAAAKRPEPVSSRPGVKQEDLIKFTCEECGMKMRVRRVHAGKKSRCMKCKAPLLVPEE